MTLTERSKGIVRHDYAPRDIFAPFHLRAQRWAILVAHRRAGKTVATVNDIISRALYFSALPDPRFAYIAPFYSQAKRIAWAYLKRYGASGASKIHESDLSITIRHNGAIISLFGADNPDSFRGQYFDGVVLDEYGNMKPSIWSEVLLPTLLDRKGWATFIGTPNGPNHFRDLYHHALKDPARWFVELLPVSRTKLISDEELAEMRLLMLEEEYEQEMECSFEASTRGAFYSKELRVAKEQDRICLSPANPDLMLHFVFDIGRRDDTAMGAFQEHPAGVNVVHAEAANMRGPQYWMQRINEVCLHHGCARGTVWLPHDARAKTWATQRSGFEQFIDGGIRPQMIPNLDKLDGINAARFVFRYLTFNCGPTNGPEGTSIDDATDKLVLALKSYHRTWDEDKQAFTNEDVHDWSSHYADMFRYLALVARFPHSRPLEIQEVTPTIAMPPQGAHHVFTLDDLWSQRDGDANRNIIH